MSTEKKISLFKRPAETGRTNIDRMDMGFRKLVGNKLFLSQESDTVYGAVEFILDKNIITGPDGTKFDLNNIKYTGPDGIYAYLKKVSGTGETKTWTNDKNKMPN